MASVSAAIPAGFDAFVDAVVVRMGYLHPTAELSYDDSSAQIHASFDEDQICADEIRRDIRFQLYRETIFQETLPIRTQLYGSP